LSTIRPPVREIAQCENKPVVGYSFERVSMAASDPKEKPSVEPAWRWPRKPTRRR
jgi:hypothetical protein